MSTHTARAVREGKWWVVHVDGVGVTQGRSAAEAHRMAADLVAVMTGVSEDEISVEVEFVLPGPLGEEVAAARAQAREAEQAQRKAAEQVRAALGHILAAGMSKQDAARILSVSPQRISQLTKNAG